MPGIFSRKMASIHSHRADYYSLIAQPVARVIFVHKRPGEIPHLYTTTTDQQRRDFGHLVEDTIRRIESAHFINDNRPPIDPDDD